ncbi:nucleolar protein 14 homolog [Anastrepha obliqua]|uniref:nucleolar protein 14 homolog n=1 Tax=Anastrepha obliqua TaxID=95512 RepID=UPI00240922D4|nr:nucleolar protein 14 homolog [Anastrepha obliqua]
MTKVKKNKKALSDQVYAKKSNAAVKTNPFATAKPATSKKLNPFEVHINKEKFQILGRTCKHDKGLPGVSRAKANKKRQETLAVEYQDKHKTNKFRDRRIGKYQNSDQLSEDVINARFVAARVEQLNQSKASRFNLNDDEVLTHRGQRLEDIEQFRDERSDDEDLDDEKLNAEFTEAAQFGGDPALSKDRQTAIDEMIAEQKKRKIEIAKEKDEVHNLTEKLDSNYKQLLGLVDKLSKKEMLAKPTPDDYDKALKEMIFEPRGVVADKLLSEEDLAKKEKERLEELERERLKRMRGDEVDTTPVQSNHRSADALDDGYFGYAVEEEDETLAYTLDGELGTKLVENGSKELEQEPVDVDDNEENESGAEEDESGAEEDESGAEEVEREEDCSESGHDSNAKEDDVDNLSDLKDSESESDNDEAENKITAQSNVQKKTAGPKNTKLPKSDLEEYPDLPYTMDIPNNYDEFNRLLNKRNHKEMGVIVERLIKCNHPKLDGINNKEKMEKLFAYLLQFINEIFTDATQDDITTQFQILGVLNPHMYDLVHMNPEKMLNTMLEVIKEKYTIYRKNIKLFPPLETLIFFKLVSNYCSTSDFRHAIVTPCFIFIQHILSKARVRTRQDIAGGLFLVTIYFEFSRLSKRFLPAALNYLLGIVYLSIPKRPVEVLKILPPFPTTAPMNKLLAIAEINDKETVKEELLQSEDLVLTTFSVDFKIRALNMALKMIKDIISNLEENIGSNYFALPFLELFERLSVDVYPEFVRDNFTAAKIVLERVSKKKLTKIVPPEKKPKALRLLEPRIEVIYDDKRRPRLTKEKEDRVKLVHKLRRETKGAIREIRKDTEFLQKMRIQQQIQSDMERKEKVKRIYQEASVQQGELNELDRLKKRKKF